MKPGLYESLVTQGVEKAVRDSPEPLSVEREPLVEGSAPHILGRYLFDALVRTLRNLPEKDRAGAQVALTNRLVDIMQEVAPQAGIDEDERVADPAQVLLSLRAASAQRLGVAGLPRPTLPLRHSDLLVNGPRDLRLGPQIRGELASADAVDVLVSFVKWNGVRLIRSELAQFAARHPGGLRVLTTTYMGATEPDALDLLQDLGAEVRVSYDARRTRLHAKAWLFHRDTGFSTALIGSSNLSPSAMLDGCEWNVRLSAIDNKTILDKFVVTFLQYWGDTQAFEPYERARFVEETRRRDPERDALARAVNLRPYPHQQAALDSLATERRNGHHKNLVVAATGTGKTVVAALDYVRLRQELGGDPTLLFVAHSEEILSQSLAMYRAALRDGNFGELRVGARRPFEGRHVFSSIQSLHEEALANLQPDAYDVVVIDEFHHAAAPSYERLLGHLRPKVLLGLTATPERTDGKSVLAWFDGRIAAELRLWDALELGLLSPFQYFGVHDSTDLSRVDFASGRYDVATLEKLYTADHVRAKAVLGAIQQYVRQPQTMRGLGFCVSVAHARFMAAFINQLAPSTGLRAVAVDGESSDQDRRAALQQLREGSVNLVFSVNLFNEGVDLPAVDTVLFLRPTESATLFLQQLGRGLRLEEGKTCLTVLDLIGTANRKFRYVDRFKALTRGTRAAVERAVEEGFPHLPAGCEIRLDEQSQRAVLANLKEALRNDWKEMAKDLRALGSVRLAAFLREADLELEEFYSRPRRTLVGLRHEAGLRPGPAPDNELTRALGRLLYLDDEVRLERWRAWLAEPSPPPADAGDPLQLMLFAVLGQARRPVAELSEALAELWAAPELREELGDLLALLADQQRRPTFALRGLPFRVHASYSRDEIAAGLLQTRSDKLLRTQSGVFKCDDAHADVLYVEIDKDPKHYTPTTFYDDRPLSPRMFQWESQAKTRAGSETGQRYQRPPPGWRTLLFVRQRAEDGRGNTSPYLFLGPVKYVSHEGEKPMKIVWELERPMPPEFFGEVKIAAG